MAREPVKMTESVRTKHAQAVILGQVPDRSKQKFVSEQVRKETKSVTKLDKVNSQARKAMGIN